MGTSYRHLTEQDRHFLSFMLSRHYPKAKIAEILKINPSTVYREIKRNSCTHQISQKKFYWGSFAQDKYLKRRKRGLKLEKNANLRQYIHKKLRIGWSPYQIEGRLKLEYQGITQVSHETIYLYIYSNSSRRHLFYKYLKRQHPFRIKAHQRTRRIDKALMITARPESINSREAFGHWEGDLLVFKKGTKTNLITLRERKSRFLLAVKNTSKQARMTAINIITALKPYKRQVHSVTFDQGSEFLHYSLIQACLEASVYFCEPASPYHKGSVENANGLLRICLPRNAEIAKLTTASLNQIVNQINRRSLRCLNYQTAKEVFNELASS